MGTGNRALLLLRLSREWHQDVEELDFLNGEPAFSVLEKLISGKQSISLCPYADSRYAPTAPVSRRLRYIKRKADMIFEERGSRELYVGWPFVRGKFSDGTAVRSPLLFFPVKLQVNGVQEWELVPDAAQPAQFNQSFLLAYAHYMGTPLAEDLLELDLSTLPKHPLEFRTQVYHLLKEHQLAVQVGREFFADKLKPFRDYKKAVYEAELKPGQLYLEQEAVLGVYPQAASYLLSDYDTLLEQNKLQEMEELFLVPQQEKPPASVPAQHTFAAFDLDAPQEVALQAVKQGQSLVVQGPPGTGKSQLICNLVSDFTARGKKVLVVSQKRAALDVVHQRLQQKGIGAFASLIHDINADRKSVFAQLQQQIEELGEYKKQNLALNSIYTDRAFLEVSRGINRCTGKLEAFKQALFDTGRCGWSAKELYLRSNLKKPHFQLARSYKHFTQATVADFLPRLREYLQHALPLEQKDFIWKERRSMQGYGWQERRQLEQVIREVPVQYQQMQEELESMSGYAFTLEALPVLTKALPTVEELRALLQQEEVGKVVQRLLQKKVKPGDLKQQVVALRKLYEAPPHPDTYLPAAEIATVQKAISAYRQGREQLFRQLSWVFSQERRVLQQVLAKYEWELNEETVAQLQERLTLRKQAEGLMQEIRKSTGDSLSISDSPAQVLQKLKVLEQALHTQKLLHTLHKENVLHEKLPHEVNLSEHFKKFQDCVREANARQKAWLQWLKEKQVRQLLAHKAYREELLEALPQFFERMVAQDTLYASLSEAEREVMRLLLEQEVKSEVEAEDLFLNSLCLAWLYELETQHPELRMPSNGELDRLETELQGLLQEKQQLSQEIVLSKLREQTYSNMEYNRLGNPVTYRRLQAQVSKKRSLYPIRKLFGLFAREVLDLVPCWLASPETVSAVLPLERCFDLVIFDEASQCFAEMGIPAMLRGKQVVVAGDPQQLKPSDLYRSRWVAPEEQEVEELAAESLLELCSLYLPQVMLTQHYRSRYPELIEFSNRFFYRQKLELVPDLQNANSRKPAIQFVKVHGLWQDNINLPEAEKVVDLVMQLLEEGEREIGVITFNYNQQMLIQDLLEEAAQAKETMLPPSVLVKNIENMQGDEKAVIILSVGYAPDAQGRLSMQFGSLNRAGGENRLNVAITRAKDKIMVVSSVRAEQLQVDETLHTGPKLLKAYLQYAQQVSRRYFEYQPKKEALPSQAPLLKERLQQDVKGLRQEVPFADLTFIQNGVYKGVLLTDDDLYYSHLSVRHSHADLPHLLQQNHWQYRKVYSRQYWEDKDALRRSLASSLPPAESPDKRAPAT